MPDVVLFRTPTSPDTYTPALSAAGYTSVSIQALDDEIQTAELGEIVSAGAEAWQGVIITSRRGAEAWVAAVDSLSKRQKAVDYSESIHLRSSFQSRGQPSKSILPERRFLPSSNTLVMTTDRRA